jgi:hypothetical protein|tara:strand:- start:1136 stop:1609 length:474 start_codon:yes stop_codon:yes gene_type:complete
MGEGGYPNPWLYKGAAFTTDDIGDFFGFVYRITNVENGRQYIGRKYFWQKRKPRATAGSTRRRRVTSESDWKNYYGSSNELKADVAKLGKGSFTREIISLHTTPGRVNYEETRQLFINNVLTEALDSGDPAYYNSNVLSRYFRKDYFHGSDSRGDAS